MTHQLYIKAVSSSLSARVVNMGAALGTLWLLSTMLVKDQFAFCMLAITFSRMVAFIVASGFKNVVLYRVSRLDGAANDELARKLGGTALAIGTLIASIIALVVVVLAQPIARLFSKPELDSWLVLLAVLIPLDVSRMILTGWYRARQEIPISVFFDMIVPSTLRVVFLVLVLWLSGDTISIAVALSAALIVPIIWLFAIQPLVPADPRGIFTAWDMRYAFKVTGASVANLQAQGIDVILIGGLSSAAVTAEYVVASRLVQLLPAAHIAVNEILMPRLGAFLGREAFAALAREYFLSRLFALLTTIGGAIVLVMLAPIVLPFFGDYHGSYPLALLLSTAVIVRIGFGANGIYLKMAGYAGWDLFTTIVSLGLTVVLSMLWIPIHAGAGGALALFVSAVFTQISVAMIIWRLDNFATIDVPVIATIAVSATVLICTAYGVMSTWQSVASLLSISWTLGYLQRQVWLPSLLKMRNRGGEYEAR